MITTPSNWTPRKGDVVEVQFLDHVEDEHKLYLFHVYGRIAKIDKKSIRVESWAYTKGEAGKPGDYNVKVFTLVKSAIEKIIKLVPAQQPG